MTITAIGIGAAPGDDTGDGLRTALNKVNNNFSDANNAASKLVGLTAGSIPLAEDTFNINNYQPETSLSGLGVVKFMKNNSGGNIGNNVSTAGSNLENYFVVATSFFSSGIIPTGTWKNVSGGSISTGNGAHFVRIA